MAHTKTPAAREQARQSSSLWKWGGAGVAAAGLVGSAVFNHRRAMDAEIANPPLGTFLDVDGVRLHYLERGEGPPIVLIHGNGTMVEDWLVSRVFDSLAKTNRVIAFDRPGFGHSSRPRRTLWTPRAQAALLAEALRQLAVEKPLVVGHSFGTQVTAALALDHPEAVSSIVLIGGYFFPSMRADAVLASPPALPVIGDVMRYTVSPLIAAASLKRINAKLFAPAPVSASWTADFPIEMTLRPWQLRAAAAEAGLMVPGARALSRRYAELRLPVTIVAGEGDRIVDTDDQSRRLHELLPQSRLITVEGAGHMVHHSAPERVIEAIRSHGS